MNGSDDETRDDFDEARFRMSGIRDRPTGPFHPHRQRAKAEKERPLHPSARTTREMRRAFQDSDEPSRALAREYGVNEKTVTKHRRRDSVEDEPMGRRTQTFTLSEAEFIERYRRFTSFNIRDCLKWLGPIIPQMNYSNLYRLLIKLDANKLPWGRTTSIKKEAKRGRGGYFQVSIVHRSVKPKTAFVAFDEQRGDAFAFYAKPTRENAARFVGILDRRFRGNLFGIMAPYDDLFGSPILDAHNKPLEASGLDRRHPFDAACRRLGVFRAYAEPIEPNVIAIEIPSSSPQPRKRGRKTTPQDKAGPRKR